MDAIVFDFDGVVIDSEPIHHQAFLAVFKPLGVRFDYPTYVKRYIGFDDRDGVRAIADDHQLSIDDAQAQRMLRDKVEAFDQIVADGVTAYPGALELIREAAAVMPIAICSGALRSDIEVMLGAVADDLLGLFDVVVTADEVKRSKPDPESYALAVKRLGIEANQGVAIEDTPTGLVSAKAAGLRTLGVGHTHAAAKLEADHVVDALADVELADLQRWFG